MIGILEHLLKSDVIIFEAKGKIFYRGGPESAMPLGKTAYDIIQYEKEELGNIIKTEFNEDDLKSINSKDLVWLTYKKEDAKEYGRVRPEEISNYKVIATDNYGGVLVQILR